MILEEVGLGRVVDAVRDSVEELASQIYPDLVGSSGLDSAKAFTVEYDAEEEAKDKELSTHFDNAEVSAVAISFFFHPPFSSFLCIHSDIWDPLSISPSIIAFFVSSSYSQ